MISIVVVLTVSSYVHSQQASDKVSYEGQTVARVDLVANSTISVESLRPLVQQKTGEPYSGSRMESTVAALRATVIPNGAPYKQDVIVKARDNLRNFFVTAGYFQAQVQPESHFDETHMLANVVFHIDLGKRAKVGNVEVHGADPAEANRLLHATRSLRATAKGASLKPGKSLTPKRIDAAIALMKQDLTKHQHLASKVHLDQSLYHQDTNRADLIIGTRPGPIVSAGCRRKTLMASVSSWKADEEADSDLFRGHGRSRSGGRRAPQSNRFFSKQKLL